MIGAILIQLVQLSTILIGLIGVAVTLRSHRRRMHARMFVEFRRDCTTFLAPCRSRTWAANAGGEVEIPGSSRGCCPGAGAAEAGERSAGMSLAERQAAHRNVCAPDAAISSGPYTDSKATSRKSIVFFLLSRRWMR